MDCSPPGSFVHGILQARILEWVAISFSKDLERVNKTDKHLTRLTKKKRERTQIDKIRNKREEITDTSEIQKIMRILWTITCQPTGQPRRNGQVFRIIQSTKTESRRNNLNKPITRSKTETVILKTHYKQKSTGEFYQTYKKELILILLKLFQKIEEEGMLSKTFYEDTITLIAKPDKDTSVKENYRPIYYTWWIHMQKFSKKLGKASANKQFP